MEGNTNDNVVSLSRKAAANRRNAQLSTRPRTEEGKSRSRLNAVKHGILASAVLITAGEGAEDPAEFNELFSALQRDLAPVGRLEEMMGREDSSVLVAAEARPKLRSRVGETGVCPRSQPSTPAISLDQPRTLGSNPGTRRN